jgi:hypothetical protein
VSACDSVGFVVVGSMFIGCHNIGSGVCGESFISVGL